MPDQESHMPHDASSHPLFSGGTVGIITAEKPKFKAEQEGENEALQHHLKQLGLKHEPVNGHYDAPENSFVVHKPTRGQMYHLGKKYGQESVIFSEGGRHQLLYTNGALDGQYITTKEPHIQYFSERPENYYTAVPNGPGFFRMNFDFDNPMPLEIHQPANPNLIPDSGATARKSEMPVTIPSLHAALLERLKKTEAELIELTRRENLSKAGWVIKAETSGSELQMAEALPGQNPSLPNPVAAPANAAPQSPVGAANGVPTGQLGPEGQAEMETGGGNCPLCGQPDVPGKCKCLQGGQAMPQMAPPATGAPAVGQPLAMSEKLGKVAPPGREEQVKALKPKVGTESAFKIAWASYDKKAASAKKSLTEKRDLIKSALNSDEVLFELHKREGRSLGKTDLIDAKGKKVERGVVGKLPPKASGVKELSAGGSGTDPKKNTHAKAEPPMAKPPSGKAPGTMTPVAKPAAPAAAPAVKPPKPIAPKAPTAGAAGLMGKGEPTLNGAPVPKAPIVAKAAPNPAMQHALIAGSKAAAGPAAPASPLASPARPLQHPAQMGRANAMQQALHGAFQPQGPVSSGLELARAPSGGLKAPPPGMRKFESLGKCALCKSVEHEGDCE